MRKYLPILMLLSGFCATLAAETCRFRGGEVLAAQLSSKKPAIVNEDPLAFPTEFEKKIYAAVVVRLMPGRALSVFDYSLEAFGLSYPCIAIRAGGGVYDGKLLEFASTRPEEKYSLLFELDGSRIGVSPLETLKLKANYSDEATASTPLVLENLGNGDFTAIGAVPDSGIVRERP